MHIFIVLSRSSGKISIQSSFDTSNIHINPNIKEAEVFKKRYIYVNKFVEIKYHVGFKWILCTIFDFDVGRNDWFFIACKYCHKKCKKIEERFECDHCRKKAVQVDLKYKLQAYVSNATGSMCVVLWDTEASQIIGLRATKVRESYSQVQ
ncbi:hypothetical protein Ahy_A01g001921 [Arachis hypogaea]|uniref:Replication factor A C-terminal domain-containing protein n=1 Tax=Arachis hypogaea TaxID=3818 RepID=A0A445EQ06_ARAHY|nr:hypothetical protein Ahy_A01g001921 [Arachis hypogaea]